MYRGYWGTGTKNPAAMSSFPVTSIFKTACNDENTMRHIDTPRRWISRPMNTMQSYVVDYYPMDISHSSISPINLLLDSSSEWQLGMTARNNSSEESRKNCTSCAFCLNVDVRWNEEREREVDCSVLCALPNLTKTTFLIAVYLVGIFLPYAVVNAGSISCFKRFLSHVDLSSFAYCAYF